MANLETICKSPAVHSHGMFRLAICVTALLASASVAFGYRVQGPIADKYAQLGGQRGTLGAPRNNEAQSPHGGRFNVFDKGLIVWHADAGAHVVKGKIFDRWHSLKGAEWGYPINDETTAPDGKGQYSHSRAVHLPGKPEASIYWTGEIRGPSCRRSSSSKVGPVWLGTLWLAGRGRAQDLWWPRQVSAIPPTKSGRETERRYRLEPRGGGAHHLRRHLQEVAIDGRFRQLAQSPRASDQRRVS